MPGFLTAFLTIFAAGLSFSAGQGPVVVASYNVLNYLEMDRFVDGVNTPGVPKPEAEIEAVVEVIKSSSPDVLGLVEMGDESMLADLQKRLKAAGLDYPGVGPEHSFLKDAGRAEYYSVTDQQALDAFQRVSRLEGIIPALETAHAFAYLETLCPQLTGNPRLVINSSGRGDKDVNTVAKALGGLE